MREDVPSILSPTALATFDLPGNVAEYLCGTPVDDSLALLMGLGFALKEGWQSTEDVPEVTWNFDVRLVLRLRANSVGGYLELVEAKG